VEAELFHADKTDGRRK